MWNTKRKIVHSNIDERFVSPALLSRVLNQGTKGI